MVPLFKGVKTGTKIWTVSNIRGGDALCNIIATVISGSRDPGRRFPSWTVELKIEKELDLFSPRFEKGVEQTDCRRLTGKKEGKDVITATTTRGDNRMRSSTQPEASGVQSLLPRSLKKGGGKEAHALWEL